MMSKNLFFKRMKQDLEQRIWLPVIFFIVSFLTLEISLISTIERWQSRVDFTDRMTRYLMNTFFGIDNGYTVVTVCVAVVSAISGFAYMHSAKKLDVYHSIPVKRERLFVQQYVYGIIYYIIPLVLHILICYGVCASNGVGGMQIIGQALGFFLVQLLAYLACYATVVVAVVLTGNLVISALGSVVLLFYSMILAAMKYELMFKFFVTYYSTGESYDFPAFSPVHLVLNMADNMNRSDGVYLNYMEFWGDYGKLILMVVVYSVIALLVYKKRPTEAAGTTMAFPITEPVVKTMVVFPVSIFSGYLFQNITSNDNEFAWYVFGCVFGFMICCPLMEVIYRKDVKAVLRHPLQWVFNGACVILCIVIFRYDVFGYDTYVPAEDKVESYAVYFSELPNVNSAYGSTVDVVLDNMAITDNQSTRALLEYAAEITRPLHMGESVNTDAQNGQYGVSNITVKYNLKNGETVYRRYLIDLADAQVLGWMRDTVDSLEYKLGAYPVLAEGAAQNYVGLKLRYAYASEDIALSREQMQRFVESYQRELTNLQLEEIMNEVPLVRLSFACVYPESTSTTVMNVNSYGPEYVVVEDVHGTVYSGDLGLKYDFEENGYRIYPSFTQTLALLEEFGAEVADTIPAEDVMYITVVDYTKEWQDEDGSYATEVMLEYSPKEDGGEKINQLLDSVVSNRMGRNLYNRVHVEENIDVNINYNYDGMGEYVSAQFKKGQIPAFVLEDVEKAAQ